MKKGILIRTNGKVEPIDIDGLNGMQEAVGGLIECALTGDINENEHWDLWANDEGRLLELPMNQVARVFIAEMSDIPIEQVFSMHGDFLLLGHDGEGASIDCPESIADIATNMAMFNEPTMTLQSQDGDKEVFFL
tara:strand:+ start:142 stop:546 length:405 start_codon:yes stop_codon:yes gene_type:complete